MAGFMNAQTNRAIAVRNEPRDHDSLKQACSPLAHQRIRGLRALRQRGMTTCCAADHNRSPPEPLVKLLMTAR
jgi:hypothetical protein